MTAVVLPLDGVPIYPTPGSLPGAAPIGEVVSVISDKTIRQWDGTTWNVVGSTTSVSSVTDTDSIDLTITLGVLSADLKISSNAADASYQIVGLNVESTGVHGLRAQIANSAIQAAISVTDTNSIDLTYTGGGLSGDLKISSNAATAGSTIVALDVESTGVVGLRAQIANADVRGLFSATTPVAYNATTGDISMPVATAIANGYLSSTDWTTFNSKVGTARAINTTAPLTGGGDLSADRTIAIPKATTLVDGYLAAADFITFNNKVSTTRTINTTAPITGGGDLSADRTLAMAAATNAVDGYLTAADHTTFAAKVSATRAINTTAPITGGGDLSADRTIAMAASTNAVDGYLTAADHTTFAAKQAAITIGSIGAGNANGLDLTAGTLTLHVGTSTQPGAISTAAQTIAGAKTFNADIIRANNTTNASFVGDVTPGSAGASATNGQSATATFDSDSIMFLIQIGTERNSILCQTDYTSATVSYLSDIGNYGLLTDAGTGIYVSKSASSLTVSVKNRMGGTRVIRVKAIGSSITSATAWA